jgi:hypothetical protein
MALVIRHSKVIPSAEVEWFAYFFLEFTHNKNEIENIVLTLIKKGYLII